MNDQDVSLSSSLIRLYLKGWSESFNILEKPDQKMDTFSAHPHLGQAFSVHNAPDWIQAAHIFMED